MTGTYDLIAQWSAQASSFRADANRLGNCQRGKEYFIEATTLERCAADLANALRTSAGPAEAQQDAKQAQLAAEQAALDEILRTVPLAQRAPEVTALLAELGPGEWGADQLGTLVNWFQAHGFDVPDPHDDPDDDPAANYQDGPCGDR
jgi:hypothetical protein